MSSGRERLVPRSVHDTLATPGQPLPTQARRHFEARLGHDFSGVRIHDDARADSSARDVQALAYTVGQHVVLRRDVTQTGQLILHELAHVVQQSGSRADAGALRLGEVNSGAEGEAREVARSPLGATHAIQHGVSGILQREVSFELQNTPSIEVETKRQWSEDEMRVLKWLRAHQAEIVSAEQARQIDRRAIAAAIAWEALQNVHRFSLRAAGPGKVHYREGLSEGNPIAREVERAGYLPPKTMAQRRDTVATASGAIDYVAAIMRAIADVAAEHGRNIQRSPVILTNVYQGSGLRQWEERLRTKPSAEPLRAGNPMAIWTAAHLDYLEDCVGRTTIPVVDDDKATSPASGRVVSLLMRAPLTTIERARWLLDVAQEGFVTFNTNEHRKKLEKLAQGEKVDDLDPTKQDVPILATEVGLVRRLVEGWLASKEEQRPRFEHGSMLRSGSAHGKGKALDINGLQTDESASRAELLLQQLDPSIHAKYGLGMPFQSDFFDPADELKSKQSAAEEAAGAETQTLSVSHALVKGAAHTYRATATRSAQGWVWSAPVLDANKGAERLLRSESLKRTLAAARAKGIELMVFPDNVNHLHIEMK